MKGGDDTPEQMRVLNVCCPAAEHGGDMMELVPGVCQGLPERAVSCEPVSPDSAAPVQGLISLCAGSLRWEGSFSIVVPLDVSAKKILK